MDMRSRTGLASLLALGLAASPAAAQDPRPFMLVELNMAPFRAADSRQTRMRAEAFLATTGSKVLSYQDNEVVLAADVELPVPPAGPLERIRWKFEKMKLARALRARPGVAGVAERGERRLSIRFEPSLYREQVEELRALLPSGARLTYYFNPAMKGLWVRLDVSGVSDPAAAARDLARRYPREVASADILVELEVLRIETR